MIPLSPVRTVAPAINPVSLAEAQAHLRVTIGIEETLIAGLIDAAVSKLDGWSGILGRCLVTQTWRQDFSEFPAYDYLRLPFPDVQSVTIDYTDSAGVTQTLSSAGYQLANDYAGGVLALIDGNSWPSTQQRVNAVRVTMVVGYGGASAVPAALKSAILLDIGTLYENRESVTTGLSELPLAYDMLVMPFRRVSL